MNFYIPLHLATNLLVNEYFTSRNSRGPFDCSSQLDCLEIQSQAFWSILLELVWNVHQWKFTVHVSQDFTHFLRLHRQHVSGR
jgi:hypothetical protein